MLKEFKRLIQKISPGLRQLLSNTAWLLADKVLRMGLGLLVGVWVARYLGPEQFGLFNYAIALVSLFSVFATLGLNKIVIRDIVRNPTIQDETLGTAFILKVLGGIATCLLTLVTAFILRPGDAQVIYLVAIIGIGTIFQSLDVIDFWYQARVESKYTVISKLMGYLPINLIKIILIQISAPLIAFGWTWTGELALGAAGLAFTYQLQGNFLKDWRWSFQRAKALLLESWPLILSGIVIMIYMRIDQIMLGEMIDERAVGLYSAAVRISEMWYLIPMTVVSSVFPSIVKAKEISETLYYNRIQQLFSLMAAMNYSVAIPITFLATPLVIFLYGTDYIEAGSLLSVQIWSGLFVSLGVARSPWLIAEGFTKFSAATTSIGAVVNILLNYFLIPVYGPMGASIATVISQMVASYLAHIFYKKTRVMFVKQTKALFLLGLFNTRNE
ncbi:MAG: flippase [Planktothrix sp.]